MNNDIIELARHLATQLAPAAAATENGGTAPRETVELLRRNGLFSLTLPTELGGAETDPLTVLRVIDEISWADPSLGWTLLIGQSSGFLGWGSKALGRTVVDANPDPLVACALAPMGSGTILGTAADSEDDPVYRVSGRWAINSGCRHAEWFIAAFAKKTEGTDSPQWGEDVVRFAVIPSDRITIVDTWNVLGLQGTGSEDVILDEVAVPHSMTFSPFFEPGEHEGPLYKLSYFAFLMMMIGGFSTGVARRAFEEALGAAHANRGLRLTDQDVLVDLWRLDNERHAARHWLHHTADELWRQAQTGFMPSPETRARFAGAVQHSQRVATRLVDSALSLVGSSTMTADDPLARAWRDVHAATAHLAFALVVERRMARAVYLNDHSMNYMI